MGRGMAANVLLLHEPVPVIKTLKGSPSKGSGLFLSRAAIFQRSFDAAEGRLWRPLLHPCSGGMK